MFRFELRVINGLKGFHSMACGGVRVSVCFVFFLTCGGATNGVLFSGCVYGTVFGLVFENRPCSTMTIGYYSTYSYYGCIVESVGLPRVHFWFSKRNSFPL